MSKPGNRARVAFERAPREIVERFQSISPNSLADAMHRSGCMRDIAAIYAPMPRVVGMALTVKVPTGDSLMVRKALEIAEPGDVIVIDGRGDVSRALWGGNRSLFAKSKGVRGVIVDGAVRDVAEARDAGFPVFAKAVQPMASSSVGPGELNFPIACGGVVVEPGDIVVADEEGIAVIPRADAEGVLARLEKVEARDQAWATAIRAGKGSQASEVDKLLAQAEAEIV